MKNALFALLLGAAVPLAACGQVHAQTQAAASGMRAQMQQIRATAKTSAFNALTAAHRTAVQKTIDAFNAGSIDRDTAASQIDSVLTPAESQAVLAAQTKMRDAMRAAFAQSQSGEQGSQGGWGHRGGMMGGQHRQPDAGRTLLMLGANMQAFRHPQ